MNKKSRLGIIYVCIGTVFLAVAIGIIIYNIYSNYMAEKNAKKALEQLQFSQLPIMNQEDYIPDYMLNENMEMIEQEIDGVKYIGVLEMPSLNITLPVITSCDSQKLKLGPCRYYGTVYKNNMIIAAHNYTKYFAKIKNLNYGDKVIFKDLDGNIFEYEVFEIESINQNDVERMKSDNYDLTLFTCNYSGNARITIRCKKIRIV